MELWTVLFTEFLTCWIDQLYGDRQFASALPAEPAVLNIFMWSCSLLESLNTQSYLSQVSISLNLNSLFSSSLEDSFPLVSICFFFVGLFFLWFICESFRALLANCDWVSEWQTWSKLTFARKGNVRGDIEGGQICSWDFATAPLNKYFNFN